MSNCLFINTSVPCYPKPLNEYKINKNNKILKQDYILINSIRDNGIPLLWVNNINKCKSVNQKKLYNEKMFSF